MFVGSGSRWGRKPHGLARAKDGGHQLTIEPAPVVFAAAGLDRLRGSRPGAGAPGNAAACRNSRVMMRTASHNSALSLGSCISAAVTVLSIRTMATLSSLSRPALANTARLTASQVSGRIALIVFVTQLPLLLEQRTARHRLCWRAATSGLAQSVATQIAGRHPHQRVLPIQPRRDRLQLAADLMPGKDLEYSGLDGAFLTHRRLRR